MIPLSTRLCALDRRKITVVGGAASCGNDGGWSPVVRLKRGLSNLRLRSSSWFVRHKLINVTAMTQALLFWSYHAYTPVPGSACIPVLGSCLYPCTWLCLYPCTWLMPVPWTWLCCIPALGSCLCPCTWLCLYPCTWLCLCPCPRLCLYPCTWICLYTIPVIGSACIPVLSNQSSSSLAELMSWPYP